MFGTPLQGDYDSNFIFNMSDLGTGVTQIGCFAEEGDF